MKMNWSKVNKAPVGVGAVLILCAALWAYSQHAFQRRALNAQGTVVAQYTEQDIDNSTTSYPVVEFKMENGEIMRFRAKVGTSGFGPPYATGSMVDVLYDPDDPSRAQVGNFGQFWLMPLLLAIFGFFVFAVGFLPTVRKQEEQE